jgi:hypothetical protein
MLWPTNIEMLEDPDFGGEIGLLRLCHHPIGKAGMAARANLHGVHGVH